MTREIPLTRGLVALVDDEDYGLISALKWYALPKRHTAYARRTIRIDGRSVHCWMHRLILPPPPGLFIDHINHNGLDNRRENLRVVTCAENLQNIRPGARRPAAPIMDDRPRRGHRRLYHEVYWEKSISSFRARALVGSKHVYVGRFQTREEGWAAITQYLSTSA